MSERIVLALPSKGRLMEQTMAALAAAGVFVRKTGPERGYSGEVVDCAGIEVAFVSASEIARLLKTGDAHLGVTGEDLIRETIIDADSMVSLLRPLGFGHADVVVAVPDNWIDVRCMSDLEEVAMNFRRRHPHRLRVATKYMNLTRSFFARAGVLDYRIVESHGATEGAPHSGSAEIIVDITSTGATLKANGLRILDDGCILKSQANLVRSKAARRTAALVEIEKDLLGRLGLADNVGLSA
jgi:ATP phosphoribosyltransferase